MNLRDRELPDRRGARREVAPRSGRAAPALVPSTCALQPDPETGAVAIADVAPHAKPIPMQVLHGQAVSAGIAIGPVVVLDPRGMRLPPRSITPQAIPAELERLDRGLDAARDAAGHDESEARTRLGPQYADILAAHCRMITDPTLRADARKIIEEEQTSAEHAVLDVLDKLVSRLEQLSGSHLSARAADVRDIEARIVCHLKGELPKSFQDELAAPAILLAHDLTPSEAAGIDTELVPGFATEAGGRASHTAIVAAALEIPAVVGLGKFMDRAQHCRMAIIDGDDGLLILDPDLETQERYHEVAAVRSARFRLLTQEAGLPTETQDGTPIELWGNIEFGGGRGLSRPGRRRSRAVPDRIPVLERPELPERRRAVRGIRLGRRLDARPADYHQDPRPGRGQASRVPDRGPTGGQPGPGFAKLADFPT